MLYGKPPDPRDPRQVLRFVFQRHAQQILVEAPGVSPRTVCLKVAELLRGRGIPDNDEIFRILESGELDQEIAAILGYC